MKGEREGMHWEGMQHGACRATLLSQGACVKAHIPGRAPPAPDLQLEGLVALLPEAVGLAAVQVLHQRHHLGLGVG